MESIINSIICQEEKISKRDPIKKIYTHTLIELKRLNKLFQSDGEYYEGIYFVDSKLISTLNRYLDRLKKIKTHYYEIVEDIDFPDILRPPLVIYGDVIKIKKEVKQTLDNKTKELLHLTFTECKAKHIEVDNRTIVIIGDKGPINNNLSSLD